MSKKPSWDNKNRQFNKMMKGNGYHISHQKGSHITWTNGVNNIVLGNDGHLRNELVWNMIRKYNLNWKGYL